MKFPKHEASLHLTHNEHKSYYMTVQQMIDDDMLNSHNNWVSDDEKKLAIEYNDCWVLQWYPDTPIGSYVLAAYNLDVLLEAANKY